MANHISSSTSTSLDADAVPFQELDLPSDPAEVGPVRDQIEKQLMVREAGIQDIFSILLAIEEAIVNAMKHGNQLDKNKKVHLAYRVLDDRFEIKIKDEGPGFDPSDVPDPTAIENLERPCGRGLMLIRHYMTEVSYNDRGNSLSMYRIFRKGK